MYKLYETTTESWESKKVKDMQHVEEKKAAVMTDMQLRRRFVHHSTKDTTHIKPLCFCHDLQATQNCSSQRLSTRNF